MSLLKNSFKFSLGTIISRIIGLVRESVLAGVFGATQFMDMFLIANRIPNLLRDIAAEGALGSAFTKVFSQTWKKDQEEAKKLFLDSSIVFGFICLIIVVLGILGAPYLVKFMCLNQHETRTDIFLEHTTNLTKVLFPFLLFMTLNSIFTGVLHKKNKFFLSAISPTLLNLGYIAGALLIAKLFVNYLPPSIDKDFSQRTILGLSIGVLLGGFMQMSLSFYGVATSYTIDYKKFNWSTIWNPKIKEILILTLPMIIAASSTQINVIVNTNFATSLGIGAVSWLAYSFRILQLPVGVFAVGIGYVLLPSLSQIDKHDKKLHQRSMTEQLEKTFDLSLWVLVPSAFFLYFEASHIVNLLFFHGNFSLIDATNTIKALQMYSIGLLGYGFIKVLISFYYALSQTKYAMNVSLIAIFINLILNFLLIKPLGFRGIALSTALVLNFNALLLYYGLYKNGIFLKRKFFIKIIGYLFSTIIILALIKTIADPYLNYVVSDLSLKIKSLLFLIFHTTVISICFLAAICLYYKMSLTQVLSKFKLSNKKRDK